MRQLANCQLKLALNLHTETKLGKNITEKFDFHQQIPTNKLQTATPSHLLLTINVQVQSSNILVRVQGGWPYRDYNTNKVEVGLKHDLSTRTDLHKITDGSIQE